MTTTATTSAARLPGQRTDPHQRRTPTSTGLLGSLNRQWQTLADQPACDSHGTAWAQRYSALQGLHTAGQVLAAIDAAHDVDPVLHALLQLHRDGDQLAGRLVLQTMLGKVRRLAYTAHKRGLEDPLEQALEALWASIATYPLHRRSSVAGNLALEALHHLERPEAQERPIDDDALEVQLMRAQDGGRSGAGSDTTRVGDTRAQLLGVLGWARQQEILTPDEVRLLHRLHLDRDAADHTMAQAAAAMGISPAALRQRHCRAVRKLASAVAHRLGRPSQAD